MKLIVEIYITNQDNLCEFHLCESFFFCTFFHIYMEIELSSQSPGSSQGPGSRFSSIPIWSLAKLRGLRELVGAWVAWVKVWRGQRGSIKFWRGWRGLKFWCGWRGSIKFWRGWCGSKKLSAAKNGMGLNVFLFNHTLQKTLCLLQNMI